MVDNKKEIEREELHRSIWKIADDLRGTVDGWDFKQYVIGMMFYRYISENITNYINKGEHEAGNLAFNYANLSDAVAEKARKGLVNEKGFFILPSELFCNVQKNAKKEDRYFINKDGNKRNYRGNLNELLGIIFENIEESAKGSDSESDFSVI